MDIPSLANGRTALRLDGDQIVWLTSTRRDGRPHAVPVWFDWDGRAVTIFTEPDTQKVRKIRHDGRVLLTLDDTNGGGEVDIFEGEATLLDQPAAEVVRPEYLAKYRQHIPYLELTEDEMLAKYHQPIRVVLTRFMGW